MRVRGSKLHNFISLPPATIADIAGEAACRAARDGVTVGLYYRVQEVDKDDR
jgi:hypothetical protein